MTGSVCYSLLTTLVEQNPMTESRAGMPQHHLSAVELELPDSVRHAGQEPGLPHLLTQTEQVTAVDRQQKLPQPWTFVGRSAARHVPHLCEALGMFTCQLVWQLQLDLLLCGAKQALLAAAAQPVTPNVVWTCCAEERCITQPEDPACCLAAT